MTQRTHWGSPAPSYLGVGRFHLCIEALRRSGYPQAGPLIEWCEGLLARHHVYTREYPEDMPEVRD